MASIRPFFRLILCMKRPLLTSLFALAASLPTLRAADFQLFEGDGFDTWVEEGAGFGGGPSSGLIPGLPDELRGYIGTSFACSIHGNNPGQGRLTSPEFTVTQPFLHFLVAGGD